VRFDGVGPGSSAEVVLDNAYLQEVAYVPRAKRWLVDANASWTVDANWQLDATHNDAVYFGPAITAGRSVEVDAEQTLSSLTMDSPFSYRILGTEALRFNGGSAPAMIDVRNGVQKVFAPMALESDATVQVLVGAELLVGSSLNASGRVLTKTGPGTLDLAGGFQLQGGTLAIEAGAEPSVLIGDNALLDGTLTASLPPGVEAKAGDVFRLVEFLTPTSTFENIVLPALSESLNWKVEITSNVLTASVVLAADFDGSGQVDGDDLAQWQLDFGASSSSDADNDGDSDGADFLRWQQYLGSSIAQSARTPASHVPEPAAEVLALAASCIIIGGGSRCVSSGIRRS
jgi:hypothetical protein